MTPPCRPHHYRLSASVPEIIVEQRLMLARAESLYVLASIEDFLEREPATRDEIELKVEILIDSIVAMLQAPISPKTAALLAPCI